MIKASPGVHRASSRPRHIKKVTSAELSVLAAITLLGALLRFSTLGEQSFWFDEALTRNTTAYGWSHGLSRLAELELTPPLYYVLVWLWASVFGIHEVGLRSFSAVCGTATIPVMWALGRQLFSQRSSLIAALLTAVNPLLFWYSQEARSYALLTLLTALSLLALLRALRVPSNGRIGLWALSCSLALGTHYFSIFMIVPEAVAFLVLSRRGGTLTHSRILLGLGPTAATAILLAPLALRQSRTDATFIERSATLPIRAVRLAVEDVVGYGAPLGGVALVSLIAGLLALVVLLSRRGTPHERSTTKLLLALGGSGVLTALLLATAGLDYFNTRNLLPTWPVFALVVATAVGGTRASNAGLLGLAILVLLSVVSIVAVVATPELHRANWRGAAAALGPARAPRAIVSYDRASESLKPYVHRLGGYPREGTRIREIDVISLKEPWLGTPQHALRRARPLPGFELVERIKAKTYLLVRYRAREPRLVRRSALQTLYPNLPRRRVMLQLPGKNGSPA